MSEQVKEIARELGTPKLTDNAIVKQLETDPVFANMFRRSAVHVRVGTCPSPGRSWRHSVATYGVPDLTGKSAKDQVDIVHRKRLAALSSLVELLRQNFRSITAGTDPASWRLVVLKGEWLQETIGPLQSSDAAEAQNVGLGDDCTPRNTGPLLYTGVYIDCTYDFEPIPKEQQCEPSPS